MRGPGLSLALLLAGPVCGGERRLEVLNAGSGAMAVLISAAGPDCRRAVAAPIPASGGLDLGPLVESGCWSCTDDSAGLAVHSRGRAVEYLAAAQICGRTNLRVKLKPRRTLTLHIWPRGPADIPRALDDAANTDWVLDRNLAGIALRTKIHWPNPGIEGIGCDTPPAPAMLAPGGLNVYYAGGRANQHCEAKQPGGPEYLLIHDTPVLGDLAHELGHALGLNQPDHERNYDNGHTTNRRSGGFDCSNSMWEGTEVLTDHYSLGQAFWLSLSASSAAARAARRMVPCSDEAGSSSPCPPFSIQHPQPRAECLPCELSVEQATRVCRGDSANPYADSVRLCSAGELLSALRSRYEQLRAHGVKMGSRDLDAFLLNWRKHLGLTLAIEATARAAAGSGEQAAGIDFLTAESKQIPGNRYIDYAIARIRNGRYTPRCAGRSKPPPSAPQ